MTHHHDIDRARPESVVLDIGGDVGAMLLYTPVSMKGQEVEISPKSAPEQRSHVQILERRLGTGESVYAGAYYGLHEGEYFIWGDDESPVDEFSVTGGGIVTVDWRDR